MTIKLAVFDIAGTTLDDGDAVHTALAKALALHGHQAGRDEINTVMGIPKPEAIRILLANRGIAYDADLVKRLHEDFLREMQQAYIDAPLSEKPGCSALFADLAAAGVRVAVDTGFDRVTTNIVLEKLGWLDQGLIHDSITSDEVEQGRPAPDMIHELMKRAGLENPAEVAKIGDTPADLQEGRNAACGFVVGLTHGSHTRDELAAYDYDALADSLPEVGGLLLGK